MGIQQKLYCISINKFSRIIALILLAATSSAYGQDKLIKNADHKFKSRNYEKAIELYEEAYPQKPNSYKIIKKLALANDRIGNSGEAEKWMSKLFEMGRVVSHDYYMYSMILLHNGKCLEANEYLNKYEGLKPGDKKIPKAKEEIEYIKNLLKDSSAFNIAPISINTAGSELGTCYLDDGVVFSSTSIGDKKSDARLASNNLPFLDLFFAKEIDAGQLVDPKPFAYKIKTDYNDGPVAYDPVEGLLYVTRFAPQKAGADEAKDVFHLQLIVAEKKAGTWDFKDYFFLNSPNYSVAHASVSADGQVIYFVSDMPGGYGGYDIYFCYKKKDGKWSNPFNVGPVVNTRKNELFPFIASDGLLYFASKGHRGLGGYDIYVASPVDGVFNSVRNVGYPINSTKDDVAFTLDSTSAKGYFSTNRVNNDGYYDIFSLELNFIPITIKGVVKEADSKEVIPGAIIEILGQDGKNIGDATSHEDGSFSCLINKTPEIEVDIKRDGYESLRKTIDLSSFKPNEELVLEIFLYKK